MKKYNYLSILVMSMIFVTSCSTTEIPLEEKQVNNTSQTYNANIKSIIDQGCAVSGCHDVTSARAGLILTNYTEVKNAAQNGSLISRMNNLTNPMPPNGLLSPATRAIIDAWKKGGFLEN